MKILAIDTATEACSAALRIHGEVTERYAVEPRAHARLILPMLNELLAAAGMTLNDLDALAFGRGPGAFTGLRIAAAVAQGLAVSQALPVIPVSNLAALAWGQFREHGDQYCLTAIDARMAEIYWAAWHCEAGRGATNLVAECVVAADQVDWPPARLAQQRWVAAGTGWAVASETLQRGPLPLASVAEAALPNAADIAELAELDWQHAADKSAFAPAAALPVYLRNDVAKKPKTAG